MYRRTGGYWQCHRQEPGLALGFRVFGCFGLVGLNGALRVRDLFGCHPDLYRSLHSVSATNEAGVPGNHGHLPAHIDTFMRAVNPNGCPVPLGQGLGPTLPAARDAGSFQLLLPHDLYLARQDQIACPMQSLSRFSARQIGSLPCRIQAPPFPEHSSFEASRHPKRVKDWIPVPGPQERQGCLGRSASP